MTTPAIRQSKKYRLFDPAPAELEALRADIAKRGVLEPIEVDQEGNVLDGHQRLTISKSLGLNPSIVILRFGSEEEKVEHILKRKILLGRPGPVSCGRAINRLLELRGVARGQGSSAGKRWSESPTLADISLELGLPERTVRHYLLISDQLSRRPDLARQVDHGEITVRAALLQLGHQHDIVSKPDLGDGISHPARYSDGFVEVFAELLSIEPKVRTILDPFAGTGRVHELEQWGFETTGVEIEPEWAKLHERTKVGNALHLGFEDGTFDAICTSPTYGNRNADHHEAYDGSTRRSYRHDLGRPLHKDNSGRLQWGAKYREFHELAWKEILRVLRLRGLFVLNVKDHARQGGRQHVAGWHVTVLCRMGCRLLEHAEFESRGMRFGSNADLRFPEQIYLFRKEDNP